MFFQIILPVIFFLAVFIQLIFLIGFFCKLLNHQDNYSEGGTSPQLGVSIVVAAWNELANIKELLPLLETQNYPDYEIIIVDDRSTDGTYDYLLFNKTSHEKLSFVRVESVPNHFTAKKYAVTMGIKKASKAIILLTDADCRPNSDNWVTQMVAQLEVGKDMVLGFSPYQYHKGWANGLIRYETFQTAVQYMSFALKNVPYMGVGRNLMYRRDLFWVTNGFASHHGLLGGDDDLFVNEASNNRNVAISIDADSHVISEPKKSWSDWIIQKKRHLSVGKRYKLRDKILLGILAISHILCWFSLLPLLFAKPIWFEAPEWSRIPTEWLEQYNLQDFYLFNDWMRLIVFVFMSWLLIRWVILAKINSKLDKTLDNIKIPKYDLMYAVYYFIFGLITIFSNPKKIKWR